MVLEPWITPSLFYQFLGKDEKTTAVDIHSFCTVLGPEEENRYLGDFVGMHGSLKVLLKNWHRVVQ